MTLAAFQDAFAHALFAAPEDAGSGMARLVAQPAFAVYRNTVTKSCVDTLHANFPAVARLVGDDWFRAAAAVYVARERPREASLLAYGAGFPAFLASFPPAADVPYLADVARVDRIWTESHVAADAPSLRALDLVGIDTGVLARSVLAVHPAARWAWFPHAPICTFWSANRYETTMEPAMPWRGQGVLLTRPADVVEWTEIDLAACSLLDACAAGRSVEDAMQAALGADGDANVARVVAALLNAGAASRLVAPHEWHA
jgi:hypothetical protein